MIIISVKFKNKKISKRGFEQKKIKKKNNQKIKTPLKIQSFKKNIQKLT